MVGEIGTGPRTLNAVQHYDVQPAVPLELWTTPPYEPAVRDGRLFARGACDNKGELLPRIWAIEAYLATIGPLPCRVRFLVEGEEEYGSGHLDALLDQRPGLRRADGALMEGGGVNEAGQPEIVGGVRGIVVVELICRTLAYDAHSSLATVLPSAPVRLAQALGSLFHADGTRPWRAWVTGSCRRPPPSWRSSPATPPEVVDEIRREFHVERFIGGLEGTDAVRAMTFAPTLNIQGLWSGFIGPGDKTITPAEAHARLDIRIVPDQDPAHVVAALAAHFERAGFDDIELVAEEGERAYWTRADHPLLAAASRVSEAVFGKPAVRYVSTPGVAPMGQVCGRDLVPMTSLGCATVDTRAHAPDENVRLDLAAQAARLMARFVDEFAALS